MLKNKLSSFFPFFALLLALYTLLFPLQCSFYVANALDRCIKNLIPSLFPFMVLVKLYCSTKINKAPSCLTLRLSKLFGISPMLWEIFALGLFCGFPIGAVGVCEIYQRGLCSKSQAEKAIALTNNCSAAFLVSVAGAKMFHSIKYGYILLFSQCLSVVLCAVILKYAYKDTDIENNIHTKNTHYSDISSCVTSSIKNSMSAVVNICGYVMFFALFCGIIIDTLQIIAPIQSTNVPKVIISSLFEMTSAISMTDEIKFPISFLLCSASTSFSGLCVYFQVSDICTKQGLSTKLFIASRALCCVTSPLFCIVLMLIMSGTRYSPVINQSSAPLGETYHILPVIYSICAVCLVSVIIKNIFAVKIHKINSR